MDNEPIKIYLAGPDVFRHVPEEYFSWIKAVVIEYGNRHNLKLEPISPIDNEGKHAVDIFNGNVHLIRDCNYVLANIEPFRGPSCDVGTAWEIGFAYAIGVPIVAYNRSDTFYGKRVEDYIDNEGVYDSVEESPFPIVENSPIDNLMIPYSTLFNCKTLYEALDGICSRIKSDIGDTSEDF